MDWRLIETAPKDGTMVLVFEKSEGLGLAAYRPDLAGNTSYVWFDPHHWTPHCPTHWQPLPEPPTG